MLTSKGYYPATFRSLYGDVPVRVRRLLACPCRGLDGTKSFAVLDLDAATVAPELAYVTARYAALAPFGKVAVMLSELLPIGGARNAGTVRNRTLRTGLDVVQPHSAKPAPPITTQSAEPVVVESMQAYGDSFLIEYVLGSRDGTRVSWWRSWCGG